MKNFMTVAFAVVLMAMAVSCRQVKPANAEIVSTTEEVAPATTSEQVDALLDRLEGELYQLSMINHDVVANVDGIIATEEKISTLIKQLGEAQIALTPDQQQRYQQLLDQYHAQTGE